MGTIKAPAKTTLFGTVLLAAVLAIGFLSPGYAQTVETLFEGKLTVTIPDNYRSFEPSENADEKYRFVRWFVRDDIDVSKEDFPFITIRLVTLVPEGDLHNLADHRLADLEHKYVYWVGVPEGASAKSVHDLYCGSFVKMWSDMPGWRELGFGLFDASSGIGRCVNVGGAFSVFTRKIGDLLVSVETVNRSDFLALEPESKLKKEALAKMTSAEKWALVRRAANAETVERILMSVRILQ